MLHKFMLRKLVLCVAATTVLSACATTTKIVWEPAGADVINKDGKKLGTTPYDFTTTEWIWEEQADSSLNEAECPPYKAGETAIERSFSEEQSFRSLGPHLVRVVLRKGDKEIARAAITVSVRKQP